MNNGLRLYTGSEHRTMHVGLVKETTSPIWLFTKEHGRPWINLRERATLTILGELDLRLGSDMTVQEGISLYDKLHGVPQPPELPLGEYLHARPRTEQGFYVVTPLIRPAATERDRSLQYLTVFEARVSPKFQNSFPTPVEFMEYWR